MVLYTSAYPSRTERKGLKMATGVIALAFGKRAVEPNPVNKRIAAITDQVSAELKRTEKGTFVVSQHEVADGQHSRPNLVVTQRSATNTNRRDELYLDTQDVLREAFTPFRENGIKEVIVVANPFLHLQAARSMVESAGFEVIRYEIPRVGFDNSPLNAQWWCRGPIRFVSYLGLQLVGDAIGKNFHGIGEKPIP